MRQPPGGSSSSAVRLGRASAPACPQPAHKSAQPCQVSRPGSRDAHVLALALDAHKAVRCVALHAAAVAVAAVGRVDDGGASIEHTSAERAPSRGIDVLETGAWVNSGGWMAGAGRARAALQASAACRSRAAASALPTHPIVAKPTQRADLVVFVAVQALAIGALHTHTGCPQLAAGEQAHAGASRPPHLHAALGGVEAKLGGAGGAGALGVALEAAGGAARGGDGKLHGVKGKAS